MPNFDAIVRANGGRPGADGGFSGSYKMIGAMKSGRERPVLRRSMIGLWLLMLLIIPPLLDHDDSILIMIFLLVVPGILIVVLLPGVPLWILISAIGLISRGRFGAGALRLAVLPFGVLMILAGRCVADKWVVHTVSANLEAAVLDVRDGKRPPLAIEATAYGAYLQTGGFLDTAQGIAYDPTGQIGKMMELPAPERPRNWLDKMPRAFSCPGSVRRLDGYYWRTSLDIYSCVK